MNEYRIFTENLEKTYFSEYATLSSSTKGRLTPIAPCELRTEFQRDRDRIIHCKAFRRLKHKTQVFLSPEGDHYRTRLTHTLEVAQIGRTIARALRLNEDLVEAIALGHDLGHTPFGHAGESTLNELVKGGFAHNIQSLRVVDFLEDNGAGLNLTYEVRNGIVNHRYNDKPDTLEGNIVIFADRFAYINHDIEDAIRGGIIEETDLPQECVDVIGHSKGKRINNLIFDVINTSFGKNFIAQSSEFKEQTEKLHTYMFDAVYFNDKAKHEEKKAKKMLAMVFDYYLHNLDKLPPFYQTCLLTTPADRVVCDFVSSFTDRYCVKTFQDIFVPTQWQIY